MCLGATILPVLFRNYSISGGFWFDAPEYMSSFRENYVLFGLDDTETSASALKPETSDAQPSSIVDSIGFYIKSPYIFDVVDNFYRNSISTFLIFPIRFDGSQTLREMAFITDNFWAEADAYHSPLNLISAFLNLLFLSFGLSALLRKNKKAGYACIAFYFLVNISASIFRFSGWRFIMPVDWLTYLLFLMGLIHSRDVC